MSGIKRQTRIRRKIKNVSDRARLCVYRSNKYMYAQIIDTNGNTLLGVFEKSLEKSGARLDNARELGKKIARLALDKKIKEIVFDKGRFAYHGKVKALAEGAREGGLQF
jgi:large subunit ribosomal protein L18